MSESFEYDEKKAIEFIRKEVPAAISEQYSDEELLNIIDIIWDYYEDNGYLSLDSEITDEEEVDPDKLTAYVKSELANDGIMIMDTKDIDEIVKAELDYEKSLEDFI